MARSKVRIIGNEDGYRVFSIGPGGRVDELPARAVTINYHDSGNCEAVVYFPMPHLDVEAPRASDGVRAG